MYIVGLLPGGSGNRGSAPGGCGIAACTEVDTSVNRMTNSSKNITLATNSLRPAIIMITERDYTDQGMYIQRTTWP